uniref:Uncharacterized protein n=1 Tax=Oreochromis aureus TaxID=47969 RepID=A0AAZ1X5D4_OREAU
MSFLCVINVHVDALFHNTEFASHLLVPLCTKQCNCYLWSCFYSSSLVCLLLWVSIFPKHSPPPKKTKTNKQTFAKWKHSVLYLYNYAHDKNNLTLQRRLITTICIHDLSLCYDPVCQSEHIILLQVRQVILSC